MRIKQKDLILILLGAWLLVWGFSITYLDVLYPIRLSGWLIRMALIVLIINQCYIGIKMQLKLGSILFKLVTFLLFMLMAYRKREAGYFDVALFMFLCADIDYKRIMRVFFTAQMIIITVTVGASLLGIIPNVYESVAGRMRYSLGFIFCTYSANLFIFALLHYVAGRDAEHPLRVVPVLLLLAFNFIIYHFTNTKAAFFRGLMVAVCLPFIWKGKTSFRFLRTKKLIACVTFPIFAVLSYATAYYYNANDFRHAFVNDLMSGRLELGKHGIQTFGVKLFGSNIEWIGSGPQYNYVDSSYLHVLLAVGLVFLVLICFLFTRLTLRAVQRGDTNLFLALLMVAFHSFTEPHLIVLLYNGFLLLLFNNTIKQNKKQNRGIESERVPEVPVNTTVLQLNNLE